MSQAIRISQLITMSLGQLTKDDFMPIVDSGSLLSTKRVTVDTLRKYFSSGSYTGSGEFSDTVSFLGTASYARNALTSSYANTASYANFSENTLGVYDNLNPNLFMPGIKVGHVIRRVKENLSPSYTYVTASISGDLSGSEAIGIVVDSSSNFIRVCYQGIADFSNDSNTSSYDGGSLKNLKTGSVYFLTSSGLLTTTEPSSELSISKPMLVAITSASGLIINYRGIRIAPNTTTSSALSSLVAGGSGSFKTSLIKIPAYLRVTLQCTGSGDAGYRNLEEVDVSAFFATSSNLPYSTPFLSISTIPTSNNFTASFKNTSSWIPHVSAPTGSTLQKIDLAQWKIKVYA